MSCTCSNCNSSLLSLLSQITPDNIHHSWDDEPPSLLDEYMAENPQLGRRNPPSLPDVYFPSPDPWDIYHLDGAKHAASKSKDPSTKTGAVIVRPDNSVASTGFNGFPMKMQDWPSLYENREEKLRRIIHCEMNALLFTRERVEGYTLYTYPFMSCDRCFMHMVQAGITRFVAPIPSADKLERWGEAFEWVRKEAKLMGVELVEIDYE